MNSSPEDTIKVPKGHYELTSGEIYVGNPLKIKGAGARKTIVDANGESRVFRIDYGPGHVKFQGMTIREGNTIEGNTSEDGGGIEAVNLSKLVLSKVAVLNNRVINDVTASSGGGVDVSGDLVIKQSLFAGNHGYNGGAVSGSGDITATDSTFFNNFGGNPTQNGNGGVVDEEVTLIDSTVAGNQCFNGDGCGGGIAAGGTLKGTIVADNVAYEANGMPAGSPGNPGEGNNCSGTIDSRGHNLEDHHDCALMDPTDVFQRDPKLGTLKDNGGQTDTLAIPHSSPAFNAGAAHCTHRDQRGVKRPQGNRCDIGAFELVR